MLLAVAGFASQAQVRVMDLLLPQIAADLHTTVGIAAMVVTAYAVTHGSIQLVIGPFGDRFGKYRTVALTCAIGAVLVALCGLVSSLPELALARLATGAAARLDHPDLDGLCRRRHAVRPSCSRSSAAISPDKSSASCSARPPAACSATWSAGAMCSSCSSAFSRSPPPGWSMSSSPTR